MAKASFDPNFIADALRTQFTATIGYEANIRIDKYAQDLEKRLLRANRGFYVKLASIVGATDMPALGTFKQDWEALKEPYTFARLKQYGVPTNQFFKRTSNLGKKLQSLDREVDKRLGRPTVKIVIGSRKLRPGYTVGGPNAKIAIGPKGKFASLKTAILEDVPSQIIVTAFPLLNPRAFTDDTTSGLAEMAVTEGVKFSDRPAPLKRQQRDDGSWYTPRRKKAAQNRTGPLHLKLGVTKQGVKRPFTRALLAWWMSNEIRRAIEGKDK